MKKSNEEIYRKALLETNSRAIAGYKILIGEGNAFPADLNLVREGLASLLGRDYLPMEELTLFNDERTLKRALRECNLGHVIKNSASIKKYLHANSDGKNKRKIPDLHQFYAKALRRAFRLSNSTRIVLD